MQYTQLSSVVLMAMRCILTIIKKNVWFRINYVLTMTCFKTKPLLLISCSKASFHDNIGNTPFINKALTAMKGHLPIYYRARYATKTLLLMVIRSIVLECLITGALNYETSLWFWRPHKHTVPLSEPSLPASLEFGKVITI